MKRSLLLTSAALALTLGLAPAMAQQDRTDNSTMKREPAAATQHGRDANRPSQKAMPEHGAQQGAANKDRSGARSTTGQASGESKDNTKAADTDNGRSGAGKTGHDNAKSADDNKSAAPKQAEDQNRKSMHNTAADKGEKNGAAPAKNAERNDSRSPAAQKSTQSNDTQKSTQSNEPNRNARGSEQERNAQGNETNRNTAESGRGSEQNTRISASLDPQKKTRLQTAITRIDARPVTNVNFSVSVGTVVPRAIDLRPVPRTIVEIVPQYRGYDFFVVRDEVVIVEPRTHRIVDVIERGSSRSRAETTTVHRPRLSAHQREIIRRHATSRRTVTTGSAPRSQTTTQITVGETLPDTVEIESFPETVYREVPSVREYRYIERGNDVYLVDPSSRRVIEEVR